jgi:hypothetical protein
MNDEGCETSEYSKYNNLDHLRSLLSASAEKDFVEQVHECAGDTDQAERLLNVAIREANQYQTFRWQVKAELENVISKAKDKVVENALNGVMDVLGLNLASRN